MNRLLSIFCIALLIPIAACSADATSTDTSASFDFQEGKDYTVLATPVATRDPSKIEIVEAFWYGCIHCFRLEAEMQEWKEALPEDVDFVGMPAIWAEVMELHAKMFYANQALGLTEKLHQPLFDEMNLEKNQLPNEKAILSFVEKQGVDPEPYRRAMNSFGVNSQVQQAKARMGAYGVRGTPELIVNGRYKLTTQMSGTHQRMLQIASALVEKERAAKAN